MNPPGLRERKKQRTRTAIQQHALRLYREQGYGSTTTEQIAAAAEVSPSTFFRYFPTKTDTVLYDRLDPLAVDAILAQPADVPPLRAVRNALREVLEALSPEELALEASRWRLVSEVPELRAAASAQIETTLPVFAEVIGRRVGRPADDEAVVAWTGAVVGTIIASLFAAFDRGDRDLIGSVHRGLAHLEAGPASLTSADGGP
ncbi:acyl-CoA-like ligand-binding transcription factor [Microlunatus parietis]|uniref:AcrR family transcriptional regulator n=1 Tax=Microlunatus parietis TaxID=682979 RepID=A0A7Y9I8J0_9ACTN|nr:TetR family transcriptional regulator [Microlunatus parietis]NYE72294.1 AcrR family transcriptional regulator [Microlunatus parietis]